MNVDTGTVLNEILTTNDQRRRPPGQPHGRERDPRTLTHVARQAFDEAEAAAYTGFSRSYLRQRRMVGEGPPFAVFGRTIRYLRRDLDAWLDAHRTDSVAPGR